MVPVLLIGDSAFPLSEYLMKPFPYIINQPQNEKTFNYHLSKCRRVVENAFGQLKARFRRISKGLEVDIKNASLYSKATCVLHNFCNDNKDEILDSWLTNGNLSQQPTFTTNAGNSISSGVNIRNAITAYLGKYFYLIIIKILHVLRRLFI